MTDGGESRRGRDRSWRTRCWPPGTWSVAGQTFALQATVVLLLVAAVAAEWLLIARDDALHEARERSLAVAEGFANSPGIVAALRSPDPTALLQQQAETARTRSDVDFLVVMNTDGVRYTSPLPQSIGGKFIGNAAPALAGHSFTEQVNTAHGRMLQAVVPVTDTGSTVVGLVSTGVTVHGVSGHVSNKLPVLFGAAAVALGTAMGGNALISRRLRRQTHGLGPAELGRMYEHLKLLYNASTAVGTTLDVRSTAQELARVAVPAFADTVTVDLAEPVVNGGELVPEDGTRLLRVARGGIHDDRSSVSEGETVTFSPSTPQARALRDSRPHLPSVPQADRQLIAAPLTARGTTLGVVSFLRSTAQPFAADDLSVAGELCSRAAMSIDNARRYTREHTVAVTLQRSLLPGVLPKHSGIDVASGYLPALGSVGGDWFDVIPLPGMRVALVVGDVVGRGLHAAATMGRLRTAVHNFSTLDVPPDELLAHLDELVDRIDHGRTEDTEGTAVTGATCLYAIYDPTNGRCTLARAGHPPPAVLHHDGRVEFPDVPAGPPLGVGGLPFEAAELILPEGSQLALYTDGLIKCADDDVSAGMCALGGTLSFQAERTPQETCDAVLQALAPVQQRDDVALLVARPRMLEADRIADWDIPADPATVAKVRNAAARKLTEWGLEELSFTTELILSELITNAVRYAAAPIRLRILHGYGCSLVCEVSDASSTAPHLRYAATMDEGGRGLFLVAQLADRWGTRYTATGKIIWSEQRLPHNDMYLPYSE